MHAEAAARLRRAGWQAVPFQPLPDVTGTEIAAALVPPCRNPKLMLGYLAARLHPGSSDGMAKSTKNTEVPASRTPEPAEELS